MRFALPFGLLFLAVAAFALSRLVANDLNRAAHSSRRMPGTSFEPDVDIDDENDNAQFESALKSLRTSDSPPCATSVAAVPRSSGRGRLVDGRGLHHDAALIVTKH